MTDMTREAVARAICNADGLDFDHVGPSAANLYRDLAAAAIAAYEAAAPCQCGELREDKARLDFLDGLNVRLNEHCGTKYRWELTMTHNVNRLSLKFPTVDLNDMAARGLKSCRDAIDKARAALSTGPRSEGGK
jgi:hypothetical protein